MDVLNTVDGSHTLMDFSHMLISTISRYVANLGQMHISRHTCAGIHVIIFPAPESYCLPWVLQHVWIPRLFLILASCPG